ncbi:MAG: hypothetical protein HOP15_05670 [Planctomycetes bacterium]|nr:hypothetical protein [Planctomycetota bacterium]
MSEPTPEKRSSDFASEAESRSPGVLRELVAFVRHSKKWWLAPILIALLLIGILVMLSGSIAAPFLYTLF